MRVLGLDSATNACSVALVDGGNVVARRHQAMPRGHAEHLMPMVMDVLADAGQGFEDIDLLAVTRGPGTFTGLRIGLAAARGMALAADRPCVGVTTLAAVAAAVPAAEREGRAVLAVIESKRADVYAQAFGPDGTPLSQPLAVLPCGLAEVLAAIDGRDAGVVLVGDAGGRCADELKRCGAETIVSDAPGTPDAAVVARIAAAAWSPGSPPPLPPAPLYLRPPDAVVPKDGGRLRP